MRQSSIITYGKTVSIVVTPTISTSAYTAADQLGGLQTLSVASTVNASPVNTQPCDNQNTSSILLSLVVLDKAKQNSPITIFFFNASPTLSSSDNAALSFSDTELQKCVGQVSVIANDYKDSSANSVATIGISLCGVSMKSATDNGYLYAIAMTSGTPTYGSTSDLTFIYQFQQDQ